jgi:pilus assembly protein CpaE
MKAVLIGDDERLMGQVTDALRRLRWEAQRLAFGALEREAQDLLAGRAPDLVVLVLPAELLSVAAVERVRRMTLAKLIVVGPASDAGLILKILHQGGCDQYVDAADAAEELQTVVQRLFATARGRVVAVVAPGGGGGASTVAVNLAAVYAQNHRACALLDLNLSFGDLAALLDVQPTFSIADVAKNLSRMDGQLFQQMLTLHQTGIRLLAAPPRIEEVRGVTPEVVETAIELARQQHGRVVVDVDPSWTDEQVRALRSADLILLMLRLDFSMLHNIRRGITFLQKSGIDTGGVKLICNFAGRSNELVEADVEKIVGLRVFERLTDDPKHVVQANNTGLPVVLSAPSCSFARQLQQLARRLEES